MDLFKITKVTKVKVTKVTTKITNTAKPSFKGWSAVCGLLFEPWLKALTRSLTMELKDLIHLKVYISYEEKVENIYKYVFVYAGKAS